MNFIHVVQKGRVTDFSKDAHWPVDKHKLLIFFPESFTPVCESELGQLESWLGKFADEDTFVAAACTDPPESVAEWFRVDEKLKDATFPIFCSHELARSFGVLDPSLRAKRATVLITTEGETIRQEHLFKTGRSLKELYRTVYVHNHGTEKGYDE